jgi:hypothetical protein
MHLAVLRRPVATDDEGARYTLNRVIEEIDDEQAGQLERAAAPF